jgi:hypothetical protein
VTTVAAKTITQSFYGSALHQAYFAPNNTVIAISGNVTSAEANQAISQAFGAWPQGAVPQGRAPKVAALERSRAEVVERPLRSASLMVALPAPAVSEPDYPAMQVIDALLGGASDQYWLIKYKGFKPAMMKYADIGVDTVGMTIHAHMDTLKEKPDLVRRFVKATIRTWEAAQKDPAAAVKAALKVKPDLTVFGKCVAGGFPAAGGVGGRADIMKTFAAGIGGGQQKTLVGGTLSANPLSAAAGYFAILEMELTNAPILAGQAGDKLCAGLQAAIDDLGLPFFVYNHGSILHLETHGILLLDVTDPDFFQKLFQLGLINNRVSLF